MKHGIQWLSRLFGVAVILGLVCPAWGASTEKISPRVARAFQEGADRARVIVMLKQDQTARSTIDARTPQGRAVQSARVSAIQTRVLTGLALPVAAQTRLFSYVPGFAAALSKAEIDALAQDPETASIQPDDMMLPHMVQGLSLVNAPAVRERYAGAGVAIAVLDTGIDYMHPDLGGGVFPNAKVIGGTNIGDANNDPLDRQGHGTACAGIAAGDIPATTPPVGDYVGGVAHDAKLYAVKITLGSQYYALTSAVVAAWEWVVAHQNDDPEHPILVISMSYGYGHYQSNCDAEQPALAQAAALAEQAGIVIFNSAGNDGYCDGINAPACLSNVMSLGALYVQDYDESISWTVSQSSCQAEPDVTHPGQYLATDVTPRASQVTVYSNSAPFLKLVAASTYVSTTDPLGAVGFSPREYNTAFAGTSAATPFSAGAAAVLQSAALELTGNRLTPAQVRAALTQSGDPVTDAKSGVVTPRLNIGAALSMALGNEGAPVLDDHGDSIVQATPLPLGSLVSGVLTRADRDCFQIDLPRRNRLVLTSTGQTPVRGQLLNVSGAVVSGARLTENGPNFTITADLAAGTYFLLVRGADVDDTGAYSVSGAGQLASAMPFSALMPTLSPTRAHEAED